VLLVSCGSGRAQRWAAVDRVMIIRFREERRICWGKCN